MQSNTDPQSYLNRVLYEALKSDASLLDFLQDHASDGIWLWDLNDRGKIWLNDRFGAAMGHNQKKASSSFASWSQMIQVDDRPLVSQKALDHFQNTDVPYQETVRFFHQEGRWLWMQIHCRLLHDSSGRPEYLLGGLKDLTQKRIESANAQQEAETLLEGPFIIKTDLEGKYTYANSLFCQKYELTQGELIGLSGLTHIVPEDHERCRLLVQKCIDEPNTTHKDTLRKPLPDGGFFSINWDFSALTDEHGNIQELLCIGFDHGERRKVRRALEEQEQRYESVVSALSEGLVVQDLTDKIVMCNDSACRILGLSREQFMGKDSYDPRWQALKEDYSPFQPEDHPSMITLRTGQPVDNVIMNVHTGEGKRSIISINSRPILNHKGELYGAVASFTDITEQKGYEQALKESEAIFKAFAHHIPGQVFIKYPAGKHVYGNQQTLDYLGLDLAGYQNSTSMDLFPHGYAEKIHERDREVHREKKTVIREFPYSYKGRKDIWYQESKFPINEYLIGGFMLDITERKNGEHQLLLTNQELSQTSQLLKDAQSLALMGNFFVDVQNRTCQGSENLFALLGLAPQEECQLDTFLSLLDPEDLPALTSYYYGCVEHKRDFETEFRCRKDIGESIYVYSRGKISFDAAGKPQYLVGIIQDITERHKAEKIRKMAEQLEVKNKEMEQFAYVASHDLQEPLRTVMSFVSLLVRKYQGQLDENADEYLRFISEASSRMSALIKGLLAYSHIGINRVKTEVDCHAMLQSLQQDMAATIQQTGAVLQIEELPRIEAYALELRQLFQNLISNALKFRKEGVTPHIRISSHQNKEEWIFAVQDNGIGIAERHQEQIFNIFQRLHTTDVYQGTGIGLANCRKIVELHHGRIWVESELDQGSTFYFSLRNV